MENQQGNTEQTSYTQKSLLINHYKKEFQSIPVNGSSIIPNIPTNKKILFYVYTYRNSLKAQENMKKKKKNAWTIIGIIIAIILLVYWLLAATILSEDENVLPVLDGTEQVIP